LGVYPKRSPRWAKRLLDRHPVIPTVTEKGHNFGHMRAQIRAHA
jgi:hypothetical protein